MRFLKVGILLAVFLQAGATAAGFFEELHWIPALIVHFRWQMAAAALVLVVAAEVSRSKVGRLVALACLTINAWPLLPYLPMDNSAAAGATSLRLLSLNLRDDWTDPQAFAALIAAENPDIIALTELRGDMTPLLAALGDRYPHRLVQPRVSPLDVALYSRWPIDVGAIDRKVGDWLPVLDARLCRPAGCLTFVGVHAALPFGDFKPLQQQQFDLTLEKAWGGAKRGDAVVVMGDLNTTPWSKSFQRLIAPEQYFLQDGSQGHGVATTFWSRFPLFGLPIDHVLISPNVKILDRRVGPDVGSDHLPLIADIGLK